MTGDAIQELVDAVFAASGVLVAEFDSAARSVGLTKQQAVVLRALTEAQPITTLAARTRVDPSNLGTVLRRLAESGLVDIGRGAGDRRVRTVERTADGDTTAARFESRLREGTVAATRLDEAERTALRDLLRRLIG